MAGAQSSGAVAMTIVLRGGTVLDGTVNDPLDDAAVVIEGDRIKEVGSVAQVGSLPSGTTVIDVHGKTVLPGLMDVHTHLCIPSTSWDPGSDDAPVTDGLVGLTSVYAVENARNFILRGITTIRDVGSVHHGIFAIQRLIDSGVLVGPRVFACGRAIAMTGGHGMIVSQAVDGVDDIRKAARVELKAGARSLKFMASGAGAESRESPLRVELTVEEMAAGVEEARKQGYSTCAHSVNPESTRNAVQAGINSIEHGLLLDEDSLRLMKEHDVHFVPTLWTYQNTAEHGQLYGAEDFLVADVRKRVENHLQAVARAHEMGVAISAGTDSGLPLNAKDCLVWELEWLTYCGLTPHEAIRSATSVNGKLLRQSHQLGTLEPGKLADVLVVDGDPLQDIKQLTRTDIVIKDGQIMVRDGRLLSEVVVRDMRQVPSGPFPPPSYVPREWTPTAASKKMPSKAPWPAT
jgi:imidazolonepropionase-like amidohydrolase